MPTSFEDRLKLATGGTDGLSFEERLARANDPNTPQYASSGAGGGTVTPRRRGDVIDQLAIRRGGNVPSRQSLIAQAKTPVRTPSTFDELTDDRNFPTTGQVVKRVAKKAVTAFGAVPDLVSDPSLVGANAAVTASDRYAKETARGNDADTSFNRAIVSTIPGGEVINDLTAPAVASLHNRPVSTKENLDAVGGTGTLLGMAAQTGLAEAGAARLANPDLSVDPDAINRATGNGYDPEKNIDVGHALVEHGRPIDPAAVEKNPRVLRQHVDQALEQENLAANTLLEHPAANVPQVHGPTQVAGIRNGTAPLDPASAEAANDVHTMVEGRMRALSEANGTGNGLLTMRDINSLKQELQAAAKWEDRPTMDSPAAVRNKLLRDYSHALDHAGDAVVPGYQELNQRRHSLIAYRDDVVNPSVQNAVNGTSSYLKKRGNQAVVEGATNAAGGRWAKGGSQVAGGITLRRAAANEPASPVAIAKAIHEQVTKAQRQGYVPHAQQILETGQPVKPMPIKMKNPLPTATDANGFPSTDVTDPAAAVPPPGTPRRASMAAAPDGTVYEIPTTPGHVESTFGPDGPTQSDRSSHTTLETPEVRSTTRTAARGKADRLEVDAALKGNKPIVRQFGKGATPVRRGTAPAPEDIANYRQESRGTPMRPTQAHEAGGIADVRAPHGYVGNGYDTFLNPDELAASTSAAPPPAAPRNPIEALHDARGTSPYQKEVFVNKFDDASMRPSSSPWVPDRPQMSPLVGLDIEGLAAKAGEAQAAARTAPETFSSKVDRTTGSLAAQHVRKSGATGVRGGKVVPLTPERPPATSAPELTPTDAEIRAMPNPSDRVRARTSRVRQLISEARGSLAEKRAEGKALQARARTDMDKYTPLARATPARPSEPAPSTPARPAAPASATPRRSAAVPPTEPQSPSVPSATPSVSVGDQVRFARGGKGASLHGKIVRIAPDGQSALVSTLQYGDHQVPLSRLTILTPAVK